MVGDQLERFWSTPLGPTSSGSSFDGRVAYAEIHANETADTAIGVLRRAVAWFAERGVTVERVLSDNGSAYKSHTGPKPAQPWASP